MPIRFTHTHTHTLSGSGINYYCVALSVHSPTTNLNATAKTRVHYSHKSQSHTFEIAILPPTHGPRVHILYIMCVIRVLCHYALGDIEVCTVNIIERVLTTKYKVYYAICQGEKNKKEI